MLLLVACTALVACGGAARSVSSPRANGAVAPAASAPAPPTAAAPGAAPPAAALPVDDGCPAPEAADDPTIGPADAPIRLVVFDSLSNPWHATVARDLEKLRERYGARLIRFVWKTYDLDYHPKLLSLAGLGVHALGGDAAFFRFRALVEKNGILATVREAIEEMVDALGFDLDRFGAALDREAWAAKWARDRALGQRLMVRALPTVFLNGRRFTGPPGGHAVESYVDGLIHEASLRRAAGAPLLDLRRDFCRRGAAAVGRPPLDRSRHRRPWLAPPPPDEAERWRAPLGRSPRLGPARALVTLVEFVWLGFDGRPSVSETRRALGGLSDEVLHVLKTCARDSRSRPTATLLHEAYAQQGGSGLAAVLAELAVAPTAARRAPLAVARVARLDEAAVARALETDRHAAAIAADCELAERLDGRRLRYLVNGKRLVPIARLGALLRRERDLARRTVGRRAVPYEELQRTARPPPGERLAPPARPLARTAVPSAAAAPTLGPPDARVVVQVFGEATSGYGAFAVATVQRAAAELKVPVRVVWRHLPDGPSAELAAHALHEAWAQRGADAFVALLRRVAADGRADPGTLEAHARAGSLDLPAFRRALATRRHAAAIAADRAAAASAGIRTSPSVVVRDYLLHGAPTTVAVLERIARVHLEGR